MVNTDKLRGIIAESRKSQKDVATFCGMSEKTFYRKMKQGIFGSDEIEKMINYLNIENPVEIFFAQKVT